MAVDIFHRRVTLSDKEGNSMIVSIEDFKKGHITDIGSEEANPVLDDYWGDAENVSRAARAGEDKDVS